MIVLQHQKFVPPHEKLIPPHIKIIAPLGGTFLGPFAIHCLSFSVSAGRRAW